MSAARRDVPAAAIVSVLLVLSVATLTGCTTPSDPAPSPSGPGEVQAPSPGLSYSDGNERIPLVSRSFTGSLPGYAVRHGTDMVDAPVSLTVAPDGRVLVVTGDGPDSAVTLVEPDLSEWSLLPAPAGGFGQPGDVAAAPDGTVLVVSTDRRSLLVDVADTGWRTVTPGAGHFDRPHSVAVGPDGTWWVTNTGNDSVSRSSDAGLSWTVVDATQGDFRVPTDVAVTPDGAVYVLSGGDASLSVLRPGAQDWERLETGIGRSGDPVDRALAAGPSGELYLTDPAGDDLYRSDDGARTWFGSDGFTGVRGVAVGPAADVFVTDGVNTLLGMEVVPGMPVDVTATLTGTPATLAVSWAPGPVVGPAPEYVVTATVQGHVATPTGEPDGDDRLGAPLSVVVPAPATSAVLTGLPAGRTFSVSVTARNPVGSSSAAVVMAGPS